MPGRVLIGERLVLSGSCGREQNHPDQSFPTCLSRELVNLHENTHRVPSGFLLTSVTVMVDIFLHSNVTFAPPTLPVT